MSSSSSTHPLALTTAQRDANYNYSQQLTKLQDEIMALNKTIDEKAAEHRRKLIHLNA
jgi:phage host-nuclease inhibitor protein Gam